jgi:hypothetical protein
MKCFKFQNINANTTIATAKGNFSSLVNYAEELVSATFGVPQHAIA